MKELTIEQKAQRYDEILARAKGANLPYYNRAIMSKVKEFVDYLIPELEDCEDNERIRKSLLTYFAKFKSQDMWDDDFSFGDIVAWFKNLGVKKSLIEGTFVNIDEVREDFIQEVYRVLDADSTNDRANQIIDAFDQLPTTIVPKPAREVEQKFHEGDWITNGKLLVGQVTSFDGEYYHYMQNDVEQPLHISNAHNWHLWTIRDVKDGDILCSGQIILLFKKWESDDWNFAIAHAGIDVSGKLQVTDKHWLISNQAHLATREQRHFLIKTMTDAGYTFDFEKKELKKTESKIELGEENERNIRELLYLVEANYLSSEEPHDRLIDFLNSFSSQSKQLWKPTAEQIKALEWQVSNTSEGSWQYKATKELLDQLKQL